MIISFLYNNKNYYSIKKYIRSYIAVKHTKKFEIDVLNMEDV